MTSDAKTVQEYIDSLPEDRKNAIDNLRNAINEVLPTGFEEKMNYGMMGWAVPHSIYPAGYHCKPSDPLPFMGIASQKNFISFYHMGIYAKPELLNWFVDEYPNYCKTKLDMGKSCIRFKKLDQIPVELIVELVKKMSVQEWIDLYEASYLKPKK